VTVPADKPLDVKEVKARTWLGLGPTETTMNVTLPEGTEQVIVVPDPGGADRRAGGKDAGRAGAQGQTNWCIRSRRNARSDKPPVPRFSLALVIALAVAGICLWGTLMGSMLPLFFQRLGVDPGIASSPFVATFVDVTGIINLFLDRQDGAGRVFAVTFGVRGFIPALVCFASAVDGAGSTSKHKKTGMNPRTPSRARRPCSRTRYDDCSRR